MRKKKVFREKPGNKSKSLGLNTAIKGIAAISIALAGVAKPKKDSVCFSSMLNFANLNAEKSAIKKAESIITTSNNGNEKENCFTCKLCFNSWYKIIDGANPKLTISASESSSLPSREVTFRVRAAKPSKKSKTPEI